MRVRKLRRKLKRCHKGAEVGFVRDSEGIFLVVGGGIVAGPIPPADVEEEGTVPASPTTADVEVT